MVQISQWWQRLMHGGRPEVLVAVGCALVVGSAGGFAVGRSQSSPTQYAMQAVTTDTSPVTMPTSQFPTEQTLAHESVLEAAMSAQNLTNAVAAYKLTGLDKVLTNQSPITLLAPSNDAFAAASQGNVQAFVDTHNQALPKRLQHVIITGAYTTAALRQIAEQQQFITSSDGSRLYPLVQDDQLVIKSGADTIRLELTDLVASNGVVHIASTLPN